LVADITGLERQVAKRALFAVSYGAGAGRLVRTGIEPKTAQRAVAVIEKLFPGLQSWKDSVLRDMYDRGYVETPYGRRRHFYYTDHRLAQHLERVAFNFVPQSFCGDIAMDSAISTYEETKYPPLIFVHDFNLIEVPEEKAVQTIEQCKEIAASVFGNSRVQFIPELKVGPTWGDMKGV